MGFGLMLLNLECWGLDRLLRIAGPSTAQPPPEREDPERTSPQPSSILGW